MVNIRESATPSPSADHVHVEVAGTVIRYPLNIRGLGDHLYGNGLPSGGGRVLSLTEAQRQGKALTASGDFLSADFWVCLDDSGLFYEIRVTRTGAYHILSASPTGTIRALYNANGYDD